MAGRTLNDDGTFKYSGLTGRGLGYYVHFHNENYRQFGIGLNEPGKISASDALHQNHQMLIGHLRQNAVVGDTKSFETFLNMVAKGDKESISKNFGISEEEYKMAETAVYNKIEQLYPQYLFSWEKLDLESNVDVEKNLYKYSSGSKEDRKDRSYIRRGTITKLVKSMNTSLKEIKKYISLKKGIINKKELEKLENHRKLIQKARKELYKLLNESRKTKSIMLTEDDAERVWKIVDDANALVKSVILPNEDDQGKAAEYSLGTFFTALTNSTDNVTDQMLDPIMTGSKLIHNTSVLGAGVFANVDIITKELNKKAKRNNSTNKRYIDSNGAIVDVIGSYDTADLIITLPDENQAFSEMGLNGLRASIKNYENIDGYYGVGILQGTPLLTALNFVTTDFANHYLNLFALGRSYWAQSEYYDELKRTLIVRGLLGMRNIYDLNSTSNQLFIVHNKSGQLGNIYKVFDASSLINDYWKDVDNIVVKNLPTNSYLPNGWIHNNTPILGAMQRITNMLLYTHSIKLSVSLLALSSY